MCQASTPHPRGNQTVPAEPDGTLRAAPDPPAVHRTARPSAWVERWLGEPGSDRRLLDFASGAGRHARLAAARGFRVLAVDRDPVCLPLNEVKNIEARVEDLESGRWSFAAERFDAVVVTHFLFRPRLDLLAGLLAAGGRLIYETFAVGNEAYGKPSNPAFLLRPDELFRLARRTGLVVAGYEHGVTDRQQPALVQRLAAVRPPFDPESIPLVGPMDRRGVR